MKQQLIDRLSDPALEERWREYVAPFELPEEDKIELRQWIGGKRNGFRELLEVIEDEDTLVRNLAMKYIELKSEWIMLNTQIQFELFTTGMPNHKIELRASLITTLIEAVENFISEEQKDRIEEFLAEQGGAKKVSETAENLQYQVEALYGEKEEFLARHNARSLEDVSQQLESITAQLEDLYREKETLLNKTGARDFTTVLELIQSLNDQIVELYREKEGQIIYTGKKIIIEGPRRIVVKK